MFFREHRGQLLLVLVCLSWLKKATRREDAILLQQAKELTLSFFFIPAIASIAFAGSEYSGKEIKQVAVPPCPGWYADNE
jgi:hypothetical protein